MRRKKLTPAQKWKARRRARLQAKSKWVALEARAALFRNNVTRFGRSGTSVADFDRIARAKPLRAKELTKRLARLQALAGAAVITTTHRRS